jgi:hypothetical protein
MTFEWQDLVIAFVVGLHTPQITARLRSLWRGEDPTEAPK